MMYFLKHIYMKTNKSKKDNIKTVEHFKSTNKILIGLTIAFGVIFIGMILYVIYKNWFNIDDVQDSFYERGQYRDYYKQRYKNYKRKFYPKKYRPNYQQNYNQEYGQNYQQNY